MTNKFDELDFAFLKMQITNILLWKEFVEAIEEEAERYVSTQLKGLGSQYSNSGEVVFIV